LKNSNKTKKEGNRFRIAKKQKASQEEEEEGEKREAKSHKR